ncbi:MAG: hypothetical protein RI887_407, partial [Actinomycetota bacterium]
VTEGSVSRFVADEGNGKKVEAHGAVAAREALGRLRLVSEVWGVVGSELLRPAEFDDLFWSRATPVVFEDSVCDEAGSYGQGEDHDKGSVVPFFPSTPDGPVAPTGPRSEIGNGQRLFFLGP